MRWQPQDRGGRAGGTAGPCRATHSAGAAAVAVDLEPSTEDFTPAELRARGHRPEGHRPHCHHVGLPAGQGQASHPSSCYKRSQEWLQHVIFTGEQRTRVSSSILVQSLGPAESQWGFSSGSSPGDLCGRQKTIPHLFFLIYPALLSPHLQHQGAPLTQRLHSVATIKIPKLIQSPHGGEKQACKEYCLLVLTWRITECEKRNRIKKGKIHQKVPFAHVSLCKNKRKYNKK